MGFLPAGKAQHIVPRDGLPAGGQTRYAVIARKRLLSMV